MALAPFFERVRGAIGGHLAISRQSLDDVLNDVTVGVLCHTKSSQNERWIAELCVNLCARLYPRLRIEGSSEQCEHLGRLALTINPAIELLDAGATTYSICMGSVRARDAVYPAAQGWVARVTHTGSLSGGRANPYAAGAAAALACAEVFRRAFTQGTPEKDVSVSLLNYDSEMGAELTLPRTRAGEVVIAGVGAVGNSALWAMSRHESAHGTLFLVDSETIELSNLQRYVLAGMKEVGRSKVESAREFLQSSRWKTEIRPESLEQFAPEMLDRKIPTVAISVDNVAGRRAAQGLLPRLIVNGWTGDNALGASWHVFSNELACLACLYHPRGKGVSAIEQAAKAFGLAHDHVALLWISRQPLSESDIATAAATLGVSESSLAPWRGKPLGELYTDVVCGNVALDVKGLGKIEMVPLAHQSTLAGVMMAAELIKRVDPALSKRAQKEALVSWDNVLQAAPEIWAKPRPREPGCICGDADYQGVYRAKWKQARRRRNPS
jgi:hypothetical protein